MMYGVRQPYSYEGHALTTPDWRRFPGWRDVPDTDWADVQWQRSHCVKTPAQLREVVGDLVDDRFYADLVEDQERFATMSMLLTPQLLNTVARSAEAAGPGSLTDAFYADPVRRYMLPVASDRSVTPVSHPMAARDPLHEQDMWVAEGLTHRYPTKVLAELLSTCPQYCGHCTRMDLVGNSTPTVAKYRLTGRPDERYDAILDYIAAHAEVRDVVVSGGDVANVPWPRLESFVDRLLDIEHVRDVRLATKALMALPQHWSQPEVLEGAHRLATKARKRGANIAVHTHVNSAASLTPEVAAAAGGLLEAGVRDVRNQGVLLRGVNTTVGDLLDLCFGLLDGASITPYYFYMADMIPNAEHWRLALWEAQELQHDILGWLPGFATPRIVCDVPLVGKRWVHQTDTYDRVRGISTWSKNYRTLLEDEGAESGPYAYYDPLHTLPDEGRDWWAEHPTG